MKNGRYIYALLLSGVLLLAGSCTRDHADGEQGGTLKLSVAVSRDLSRAVGDDCTVNICNENGGIVRQWHAVAEIPDKVWLASGDYCVEAMAGVKADATFDGPYYYGKQDFTISPTTDARADVVATIANSMVKITFTSGVDQYLENYKATLSSSKASLDFDNATGEAYGYFLLPEGENKLAWSFTGTKKEGGSLSKSGEITVQPGKLYSMSFSYTSAGSGQLVFGIEISDAETAVNNDVSIYGKPVIDGAGFDLSEVQQFADNDFSVSVRTAAELKTLTVSGETLGDASGGNLLTAEGKAALEAKGVSISGATEKSAQVVFSKTIFEALNAGRYSFKIEAVSQRNDQRPASDATLSVNIGAQPATIALDGKDIGQVQSCTLGDSFTLLVSGTSDLSTVTLSNAALFGAAPLEVLGKTATELAGYGVSVSKTNARNLRITVEATALAKLPAGENAIDIAVTDAVPTTANATLRLNVVSAAGGVTVTDLANAPAAIINSNVWATHATLRAVVSPLPGAVYTFYYAPEALANRSGSWSEAATVLSGTALSAEVTGLTPATVYVYRVGIAVGGQTQYSDTYTFTTDSTGELPDRGFETWTASSDGKYSTPYTDTPWWDSGNAGSTLLGGSSVICYPDESSAPAGSTGSTSACLHSRFVGFGSMGAFAAGNLFSGSFGGRDGMGGYIHLGRPFTARPESLSGWWKYTRQTINQVKNQPDGVTITKGSTPDAGTVYVVLGDWGNDSEWMAANTTSGGEKEKGTPTSPIVVNTTQKIYFDFKNDSHVLGWGQVIADQTIADWTPFKAEITYSESGKTRKPTHIVIVCSASIYGDYLTGGENSMLWLDDLELNY
ncbi:MAG: DUF4493 domain-containing protein [Rikenellaceae bacterium]|nr:DUF4493 domain-containing protein [Rikenellaceae bacterium]